MDSVLFSSDSGNKYIWSNKTVLYINPEFDLMLNSNLNQGYQYEKYTFLKERGVIKDDDVVFETNIDEGSIKKNIANLKQLLIEVTDECNMACKYCGYRDLYDNYDPRKGKKQTFEQVRLTLDYLFDIWKSNKNISFGNTIYVGFYGGEPLLDINLIRNTVEYIKNSALSRTIKFRFNITTNGLLINKYIDFLYENNFSILISLDGNENNNSYRVKLNGSNSFQDVFRNISDIKHKYPEFFKENVSFNSVLHNRNAPDEIISFIQEMFDKRPKISELSTVGIAKNRLEEFNDMYKNKYDNVWRFNNISESSDIEYLLNNPSVSIYNMFIDGFVGNTYNSINDLFSNDEIKYFPTGTCQPFSRKMFLTVNGKLLHCEKIGQSFQFGIVSNSEIYIDYKYIIDVYHEMYSKISGYCSDCFLWKNCGRCMFLLNEDERDLKCDKKISLKEYVAYLSKNISTAETYPYLHEKLINEIINV